MTQATDLADATASSDPEVGLAAVASLRALLESLEALQVDNAREPRLVLAADRRGPRGEQAGGPQEARRRAAAARAEGAVMFERFSKSAREVVVRAQAEAAALGQRADRHRRAAARRRRRRGPGGARARRARRDARGAARAGGVRRGLDGKALAAIGIDLDEIRRRAEESFGPGALERGPARARRPRAVHAAGAKKALELVAARGDRGRRRARSAPEHVLLGVLREGGAETLLRSVGAEPAVLREALSPAGSRRGRGA